MLFRDKRGNLEAETVLVQTNAFGEIFSFAARQAQRTLLCGVHRRRDESGMPVRRNEIVDTSRYSLCPHMIP